MITLGLLVVIEILLYLTTHADLIIPPLVEYMMISLLLIGIGWTAYEDTGRGFISRICLLLATGFYFSQIARWSFLLESSYPGASSMVVEILALSMLVIAPIALFVGPVMRVIPTYDYYIGRNK